MPTPTPPDPFTPQGAVTRALLERYVRGELGAAEQHAFELHLEQDPLLRDAAEGLRMPGALDAMPRLERPSGGTTGRFWPRLLIAGGIITAGWMATLLWVREEPAPAPVVATIPVTDLPYRADSVIAVVKEELSVARPLPMPQQIGHEPEQERPPVVRDSATIQPASPIDTIVRATPPPPEPAGPKEVPSRIAPRSGRELAFVHDLKLVDPKELYERSPLIMEASGVPASFADADEMRERTDEPRTMRYLDYMDEALGKFVRNEHGACLEDLLFLLGQYPKDINARFYAGLCCYNLGLPERALGYLEAVSSDPIDTFREEALWYVALSAERAKGPDAAKAYYERVAREGGFYAAQARAKLMP